MNGVKPKPLPSIPDYGEIAIDVKNLTFAYEAGSNGTTLDTNEARNVLQNLNLQLSTGSRCLLIGANGSGKSTLQRILAGRHLTKFDGTTHTKVLGLNAFHDTRLNFHRAYLDCDWGMRSVAFVGAAVPMMADIPVHKMMERLQASYPERRDELVDMLGINLDWRMNQLSDGQRRRVQILLGLIRPFRILLLDEITTSLDVCVRQDLLRWLVKESEERKATIIYATHIFDGLDDWATDLFYLNNRGQCGWQGRMEDLDVYQQLKRDQHPAKMLAIAEHWLRQELEEAKRHNIKEKAHGANAHTLNPKDHQGGYSGGRLAGDMAKMERQSRLSDMMGNPGVLEKVRRVGE